MAQTIRMTWQALLSLRNNNIKYRMSSATILLGILMLSILGKIFSRQVGDIFPQKTGFSIGDKLHEMLNPVFWGKNKQNITNLSSAELTKRVVNKMA